MTKQALRVIKPGDELIVAGVQWDDHWEFDCPTVLYRGIKCFTPNIGSMCKEAIREFMEDKLMDVAINGQLKKGWHPSDLREFKWRGWSPKNFARRRGVHLRVRVDFVLDRYGDLSFEMHDLPGVKA